jgi:hypothetical protein
MASQKGFLRSPELQAKIEKERKLFKKMNQPGTGIRRLVDPFVGGGIKSEPQDAVDWERIAEGVCANVDKALQDHIKSAEVVSDRRHAEVSAVLGFDTKALEQKLFAKPSVPRMNIIRRKKR